MGVVTTSISGSDGTVTVTGSLEVSGSDGVTTLSTSGSYLSGSDGVTSGSAGSTTYSGDTNHTIISTSGSYTSGSDGTTTTEGGVTTWTGASHSSTSASGSYTSGSDGATDRGSSSTTYSGSDGYTTTSTSGSYTSGSDGVVDISPGLITVTASSPALVIYSGDITVLSGHISASLGITGSALYTATTTIDSTHVSSSLNVSGSAFYGDGSNLTGLASAAITTYNSAADNRVITSVNSTTVQGESGLTYDGTDLIVAGNISASLGITGSALHATSISGSGTLQIGGTVQLDGVAGAVIDAANDSVYYLDVTDGLMKSDSFSNYATVLAGEGLAGAVGALVLDLNGLGAGTVDVAADSIAIIDADSVPANLSKKESIADLVTAMAGSGLSAAGGIITAVGSQTTEHGDGNAVLSVGFNYMTSSLGFTLARTWTLPSGTNGDMVYVKAPMNSDLYSLTVSGSGSQLIDGDTTIVLNADYAAVSLCYVGPDIWMIF